MNTIPYRDPVKTHSNHFMRYTVRVNEPRIFALNRAAKEKGCSADAILSDIIEKSFDEYVENISETVKMNYRYKGSVALWNHQYLLAPQLEVFKVLSRLAGKGKVVQGTAAAIARAGDNMDPRLVGQIVVALKNKGLIDRLFIKKIAIADGRKIADLHIYVIRADIADVVML